jgi:hypothetical protein
MTRQPIKVYLAYFLYYLFWFLLLTFVASFGLIAET